MSVALFLFGTSNVSDQDRMITTVVVVSFFGFTLITTLLTIHDKLWKIIELPKSKNREFFPWKDVTPSNIGLEKFVSELPSSLMKTHFMVQYFLYCNFYSHCNMEQLDLSFPNLCKVFHK